MGGGAGGGWFENTRGSRIKFSVASKADALKSTNELPELIQKTVKSFFKGGSNKYTLFSVAYKSKGGVLIKMEKPGDVPGSKAVYYKELDFEGHTVRVYKETYGPDGQLIHIKEK